MNAHTVGWWRHKPLVTQSSASLSAPQSRVEENSGSNIPFYSLLLFTFILLLAPQQRFPVLAPLRIALLAIVIAFIAHAVSQVLRGDRVFDFGKGGVPMLVLTLWAIVLVPISIWPGGSVIFLLETFLKTVMVFFLIANIVNTTARLHAIAWALVLMAVPLALTAIMNLVSGVYLEGAQRIAGYDAPLTANPNDMALMLNLILPFAIGLLLGTRNWYKRIVLTLMIFLLVAAILATYSRAGFLTLAVCFISYFWLLRNRPQRFLAPAMLFLLVFSLPFMPGDYVERLSTITNTESDETGSAQARMQDTGTAIKLVMKNPIFGSGIGTNLLAMNAERGSTWTEVHNVYLAIAVELGVPGLIMFLMLLFAALRNVRQAIVQTRDSPSQRELLGIAEAIKVSLLCFCVAALFHPVAYHFYFYYIAGLAVALGHILNKQSALFIGEKIEAR